MKVSNNINPKLGAKTNVSPQKTTDIGRLANSVANKSGVQKQRIVQGRGNSKLDKDAFFKLMLTHVKNQDPTNPLKSHEMASQLAQFSSLEQMSNIKNLLSEMNSSQSNAGHLDALKLMDKVVSGDMSNIQRMSDSAEHMLSFQLKQPAQKVQISITDSAGKEVRSIQLKDQAQGLVKFKWDGKSTEGKELNAGMYRVNIAANSSTGRVDVETGFRGKVSGVEMTRQGALLKVGDQKVFLKDIKSIENVSAKSPQAPKGGQNMKLASKFSPLSKTK